MSAGIQREFPSSEPPGTSDSTEIYVLDKLRIDQRRDWETGERRTVESYLLGCPELLGREELLLDFIYSEYCLREEFGDRPAAEEYCRRFPQYADRLTRLFAVHAAVEAESPAVESCDKFSRLFAAGEFEILERLADGGMGCVYLGRDLRLNREVAVKVSRKDGNLDRFLTEAIVTARLPHPGIPPIYAFSRLSDGTPCLAMKLVHGRTLADILRERPTPPDDLQRFVQIFESIAQTVGFAHAQGIIHRDLKPRNVMVGEFGEVQVVDWGLAKDLRSSADAESDDTSPPPSGADAAATLTGAILGTPSYMAPEQARGERCDCRTDVFALGAVLATILTGRPAFTGESSREIIEKAASGELEDVRSRLLSCGADGELITLALRCMAYNPDERPADGRVVADLTATYRSGITQRLKEAEQKRVQAVHRVEKLRERRNIILICAAIVITGVLIRAGFVLRNAAANAARLQQAQEERDKAIAELAKERRELKARENAQATLRNFVSEIEARFSDQPIISDEDKKFARQVIEQLDEVAKTKGDSDEARVLRADSRFSAGVLRHRLGDKAAADRDFTTAIQEYRRLEADFPLQEGLGKERARMESNRQALADESGSAAPRKPLLRRPKFILPARGERDGRARGAKNL